MSEKNHPGQLLFVGFEGLNAPADLLALIAAGKIGGVILFSRNVESPEQVRALSKELLDAAPADTPLLMAIDQEGGRVQRFRAPWSEWPPMRQIGERDDLTLTRKVAQGLARELKDFGIGLDFAPVVDVDTNPDNPIIGDRSFARESDRVARHGAAFIEAMQGEGVAACAKHFPGHGDTDTDSHLELPVLEHDLERLRSVELPPFEAAVEADVASIMTAHIIFRGVDTKNPATLSKPALDVLRKDMGYDGVIFSDDLEMKAVAENYSLEEQVQGGLDAGIDAFLVCSRSDLRDDVLALLEEVPTEKLREPLRRVATLKDRYATGKSTALKEGASPPYAAHEILIRDLTA
ncbi:MAG: beta-N-acetylhexosaminidase [Deltaproteobacteria bacterium]|nr:beta-N-acetylhexosaminidase [Deltaproteobacteria bacterium]